MLAQTDGEHYGLTLGTGYEKAKGSLSMGPYVRVSTLNIDIDGYIEGPSAGSLALEVDPQEIESLVSILGFDLSKSVSRGFGVLVPQARLEWNHEFDDDSRLIRTRYFHDPFKNLEGHDLLVRTDEPDRDYYVVSLSLAGVFRGGNQAFISYDALIDYDDLEYHLVTVGLRFAF